MKYLPEEFHGTLLIYELAGIRREIGTLGLRSIGEDESIETIYPMRDKETGKMVLGRSKTNARNFISTESGLDIHNDLYRRIPKVSMNDSTQLTKRVLAKKMRDAAIPNSLKKRLGKDKNRIPYSEDDFQNALRNLNWNIEAIVFPPRQLLGLLDLAVKREQEIALRSQIDRILNFVKVLAILHQKQRITFKIEDEEYIIASSEDYAKTMQVLAGPINETISRIEKRQAQALQLFESNSTMDKHSLAGKLGVSTVTAARILKTLFNQGYLREFQKVKPYRYELSETKAKKLVLSKNTSEYSSFYEKELGKFLNHTLSPYQNVVYTNLELVKKPRIETKQTGYTTKRQDDKVPSDNGATVIPLNGLNQLLDLERTSEKHLETKETPSYGACPLCNNLLPSDLANTTLFENKNVHLQCYLKLKEGRIQPPPSHGLAPKVLEELDEFFNSLEITVN